MVVRMWGKGNTPPLLVGVQIGIATLEISMMICQKIRKQPTSRRSNTTFMYIPKGCPTCHKDTFSNMFIAALFVIDKT